VDAAVDSLNAAVHCAMDRPITRGCIKKPKYTSWFSTPLRYYVRKKNYFHKIFKKKNTDFFTINFQNIVNLLQIPSSPTGLPG
jgi:hypothetical protein